MRYVFVTHYYPPESLRGVPPPESPLDEMHSYLKDALPHLYTPIQYMTDKCAAIHCELRRMCNRVKSWSPEFHNFGKHFSTWVFATHVVSSTCPRLYAPCVSACSEIAFGDEPGYLYDPPSNMVFVQQGLPRSPVARIVSF